MRNLLRAFGSQLIEPINAGHAQQIELTDEVAEDNCAVAGHGDYDRIERQSEKTLASAIRSPS